ncbi:MAG: glycosyltransferase family 4 protein [Candidatus Doudnabacteria bacterium]|nr:glycosyltransferase family 4 protein [Candidatus Doudnabacteria bacterium]
MKFQSINQYLKKYVKPYWKLREAYVRSVSFLKGLFNAPVKYKKRILFYNIMGLGYSGTDKFLQVLAKNLNKAEYDVYFMYADKAIENSGVYDFTSRLQYLLDGQVFPIRFEYKNRESVQPYFVQGMSPNIFKVIKDFNIDLLVTAGAGGPEFPFASVLNIPIIFINVFGEVNLQKNLQYHICISKEVAKKLKGKVDEAKIKVMWVPSEGPVVNSKVYGQKLRTSLGIPENDLVFGRIGRSSEGIFDPIGIRAFQRVVKKYPNVHYLIISPSKSLEKIVTDERIPNVHFTEPSGEENKMWGFYEAMDVLAHFRKDGESFGLNIAEAMFCGKPIISHKSVIWNAHLEYLSPEFSMVADTDDVDTYERYMEIFVQDREKLKVMGEKAREFAQNNFHIRHHIEDFEKMMKKSL